MSIPTIPPDLSIDLIDRSFLTYQLTMALHVETSWCPYQLFHRTFLSIYPHLLCRVNRVLCIPRLSEIVSCRLPHLNWTSTHLCKSKHQSSSNRFRSTFRSDCIQSSWWRQRSLTETSIQTYCLNTGIGIQVAKMNNQRCRTFPNPLHPTYVRQEKIAERKKWPSNCRKKKTWPYRNRKEKGSSIVGSFVSGWILLTFRVKALRRPSTRSLQTSFLLKQALPLSFSCRSPGCPLLKVNTASLSDWSLRISNLRSSTMGRCAKIVFILNVYLIGKVVFCSDRHSLFTKSNARKEILLSETEKKKKTAVKNVQAAIRKMQSEHMGMFLSMAAGGSTQALLS